MSDIKYKQLPGEGWTSGRHYHWHVNHEGGSVECENIWIAAALMSHSVQWDGKKFHEEYVPGKYAGTMYGKTKDSGEIIFIFIIAGDPTSLWARQRLFHGGKLYIDAGDLQKNRNLLLDALTEAKYQARAKLEKNLQDESQSK